MLPEPGTVETVRPAAASLAKIDERVRDYLRSGDDLMAADLAFNEAGQTAAGAVTALRDWRARQQSASAAAVSGIETQQTAALGALVLAWAISLVLVWKRPEQVVAGAVVADAADASASVDAFELSFARPVVTDGAAVDLQAAAQASEAFARAGDAPALKAALGRGAEALGAKGVVVWLGVEEHLFAVASHGYDERHLKRPIARDAENVTAETWRTGQAVTIPGEGDAPGVVVVPMADAAGCRGVVSAELLPGRVAAADRQALLLMFAAQLGGIVGAAAPAAAASPAPAPAPATRDTAFDELAAATPEPAALDAVVDSTVDGTTMDGTAPAAKERAS